MRKRGANKWQGPFLILLVALLWGGKFLLEAEMGKSLPPAPVRKVVSYLEEENPEGATLAGMAVGVGLGEVVADFLFLQSIQIFGDWKMRPEEKFKRLYPVLQAMSCISPKFVPGYSFGALSLQELGYVSQAIDFLNEGIANNPGAFELWLYRDFTIRLFITGEYKKAIAGIRAALQLEGHPPILERILAYAYEKDGQIERAIFEWRRIYHSTQDPVVKKICRKHIKRLTGKLTK